MNEHIDKLCKMRDEYFKRWKQDPSNKVLRLEYNRVRNKLHKTIEYYRNIYYRSQIKTNYGNPIKLWNIINSIAGKVRQSIDGFIIEAFSSQKSSTLELSNKFAVGFDNAVKIILPNCSTYLLNNQTDTPVNVSMRFQKATPTAIQKLIRSLKGKRAPAIQSCDFAPKMIILEEDSYLLATAGEDSYVKLWRIDLSEEGSATLSVACSVQAHGGGADCVRWGPGSGALLASCGGDRWARVWRAGSGGAELLALAAVPAAAAPVPAVALLCVGAGPLLAVGSLAGDLSLWQLSDSSDCANGDTDNAGSSSDSTEGGLRAEDGEPPRFWDEDVVVRWLRDYVTRAPGMESSGPAMEPQLIQRIHGGNVTGVRLMDDSVEDLLDVLFNSSEGDLEREVDSEVEGEAEVEAHDKSESSSIAKAVRERLVDELQWLRRPPPPPYLTRSAPHMLLCAMSHLLPAAGGGPARAADGRSYCRAALAEAAAATAPAGPPASRRLAPNYRLTAALRRFLLDHEHDSDLDTEL
ncbi:hypothetical protein ACJJTC_009705 [Scirpophaga incertulas]